MKRRLALLTASLVAVFVAACAGHGGSPLPGVSGSDSALARTSERIPAHIRIFVPRERRHAHETRGFLHQHFISASAQGAQIQVFPHGQRTGAVDTVAANIAGGSKLCTGTGTGRNCTIDLKLHTGVSYDFVVTIYDAAPSGNTPAGKQLGIGVSTATMALGKANTVHVTVSGIVSSLSMTLPGATLSSAIAPITLHATVNALDSDGNTIATDSYIDANGNPLSISMADDSAGGTAVTFAPSTFSSPVPGGVAVNYIPINVGQAQLTSGFNSRLQASATGITPVSQQLTVPALQMHRYPAANTGDGPYDIISGPGSQLWTTNRDATSLGLFGVGTNVGTTTDIASLASNPFFMTTGPDGAVWFTEETAGKIGRQDPNNLVTGTNEYSTGITSGAYPLGITTGNDGALWFAEFCIGKVGRSDTLGHIDEHPLPSSTSEPFGIISGPDHNLWIAESESNKIARMVPSDTSPTITEYTLTNAGSAPYWLAAGPDGAMYFTEFTGGRIGRILTDGTITNEFSIPTHNSDPFQIAQGPDGGLWFTEVFTDKIGRMTTSGSFAEFPVPGSYSPTGITLGPDGALWFTAPGDNAIYRVY